MQKKTRIALAATAAVMLAVGGVAGLARADKGGMMGRGHGHHTMMSNMAERYDANQDGKITQEEIDQNRAAWLTGADADKNATLSLDEFKILWLKAKQQEMVREFQFFDRDGNGQVTGDEYKAPMAGLVADMDQNQDGALSKDDHQRREGRGHRWMRHGQGAGPAPMEGEGENGGAGQQ